MKPLQRVRALQKKSSARSHEAEKPVKRPGSARKAAAAESSRGSQSAPRQGSNQRRREGEIKLRRVTVRRKTLRRLSVRSGQPALLLALILGVLVALGWGWQQLKTVPWMRINSIEVKGLQHYQEPTVLELAHLELGQNLLDIHPSQAERILNQLPGVQSATVTRKFPAALGVQLHEKEAVAVGRDGVWAGLYDDGETLAGATWQGMDLPIVENLHALPQEERRLMGAWLARVREEKPELYGRFSQIEADKNGSMMVVLREGDARLLIDPQCKSLNSLDFLKALLRDRAATWKPGATVDLRVADHAYVH